MLKTYFGDHFSINGGAQVHQGLNQCPKGHQGHEGHQGISPYTRAFFVTSVCRFMFTVFVRGLFIIFFWG